VRGEDPGLVLAPHEIVVGVERVVAVDAVADLEIRESTPRQDAADPASRH
jgi:hypothetical protein